jgi:hypothetical protein
MRSLRPAPKTEMVAVFLTAEARSVRYGPQIRQILARLGRPPGIAEHPDTGDEAANAARRQILAAAHHAYPAGDVFLLCDGRSSSLASAVSQLAMIEQ